MNTLADLHSNQVVGTLSCFDRVIIFGSLPDIGYADAMKRYLSLRGIRLFDYAQWAEPLRDEIRANAERLAAEAGIRIEYIRKPKAFRKDDRIRDILAERGTHPGLVHIFSATEPCSAYQPWHNKETHVTSIRRTDKKCLHYYFYFIDPVFGLGYVRVPTWAPFRLQIYFNGHFWLERKLLAEGIDYRMLDNSFSYIADFEQAQRWADRMDAKQLHRHLNQWAAQFCPLLAHFPSGYHWSLHQVEYSTDLIFRRQSELQPLYETLTRTAIHAVKPDHVATFLGHKLTNRSEDEVGNRFNTRIEGTCIRHHLGPASIKLYDKHGLILRVETTLNDVSFLRTQRSVQHHDGTESAKVASLKKSIYSLAPLRQLMNAANHRYLAFLAAIDHPDAGLKALNKMSTPAKVDERSYRGFNLFLAFDLLLFQVLARGEWAITGFCAKDLRAHLPGLTTSRASYLLKRLRTHNLIRKIGHRYKYYLTKFGKAVLATGLVVREMVIIPKLQEKLAG
jgi:hypothetical protein